MLSYLSPNYIVGTSGRITFSGLAPRRYELRVSAVNNRTDEAKRRRRFEISDDPTYCTTHLINDGVTINGDNVTVEFAGNWISRFLIFANWIVTTPSFVSH